MADFHHDETATLIRMANQIATAFRAEPEPAAVAAIADHVGHFWTRGMRTRLAAIAADVDQPLDPLVRKAVG